MINLSVSFDRIKKLANYLKTFMAKQDKALYQTAKIIAHELEKLMLEPTKSWEHKPIIKTEVKKYSFGYRIEVTIEDEPYFYVNFGTKPHRIYGTNVLRFGANMGAKTSPNSLGSQMVNVGGNYIFAKFVDHPGIQARRFDLVARKQLNYKLPNIINTNMKKFWQSFFRGVF